MSYSIPIEVIELELDNYHILVDARFPGGEVGKWVIDTGASKSIFDENLSKYFEIVDGKTEELHSAGFQDEPIKSRMAKLKTFYFGKRKVEGMKAAVMDLSHINALYSKTTNVHICGLLGSDALMHFKAVIDYRRKRLVLRK